MRADYQLTKEQRNTMCFAWHHLGFTKLPLRLHVTNNWNISKAAISSFTKPQQQLIDDILASVLSQGWPDRIKRQARDDTGRAWSSQKIAIFGSPEKGPCQCVISGFRLTLRKASPPRLAGCSTTQSWRSRASSVSSANTSATTRRRKSAKNGIPVFNVTKSSHFSSMVQGFFYIEIRGTTVTAREYQTKDGWQSGLWTPQVWTAALQN